MKFNLNPLSPNIHIQILQTDRHTFPSMNELKKFDKRSRHFPLGDHFINSHNLISRYCMDIIRRKLTLVTIGTLRVKIEDPYEGQPVSGFCL